MYGQTVRSRFRSDEWTVTSLPLDVESTQFDLASSVEHEGSAGDTGRTDGHAVRGYPLLSSFTRCSVPTTRSMPTWSILGAPTDEGSPFMPGSRSGPVPSGSTPCASSPVSPATSTRRRPSLPARRDGRTAHRRPRRRRHHPHQRGRAPSTTSPSLTARALSTGRHADHPRGRPRHLLPCRARLQRAPLRDPLRRPPRLHALRPRGLHDQRPRLPAHRPHAARAGSHPGGHPQPAHHRGHVARHPGGRQPVVTMAEFRHRGPEAIGRPRPRRAPTATSASTWTCSTSPWCPGCVSAEPAA